MSSSSALPRRSFLGRLAAGAAAIAAAAVPSSARAERLLRSPAEDPDHWLDALTGKHRQIYDVISLEQAGTGTAFARNFLNANNDGYGLSDQDVNVVVSFRHKAFAMGLNDAMWQKYRLGELLGYNDERTHAPVDRNTSAGSPEDNRKGSASLAALHSRGAVFTVCGMAMAAYAGRAGSQAGTDQATALADFRANLVPGAVEVVAGVIAVNRAQERGLSYVYVG
jgi:intracellular sulfur oxidation DsrE/DsrF family protein